jgi:hypothetical protein
MSGRLALVTTAVALMISAAGCGEKAKKQELPPIPVGVNLIKNPSFEEWMGALPAGWELQHFDGLGQRSSLYGKSTVKKKSGSASFYLRGMFNVDRWMVLVQRFRVDPEYRMTFSAEIMGENLQKNRGQLERANIYVRFYDKDGKRVNSRYYADAYTPYLIGTSGWQRYERRVEVPEKTMYAELGLICQLTGWVYFDDVEVVLDKPVPWKEIQSKYVNYYYLESKPFPPGAIDKENAFVKSCLKKLHFKTEGKVSYYYYPSVESLQEIEGVENRDELRIYAKRELHTTESYKDHEMIHMLLAPLGYPPFGLAEGAVFYVLGSWQGRDLHMMAKELVIGNKLPPLFRIFKRWPDMENIGMGTAVPAWCSFSIWLIDNYGIDKFMKLYKSTDGVEETDSFNELFKGIYGKDFLAMDGDWRRWIVHYQPRQ